MANKIKSKGTALLQEISSVYTAIPQLIDISISGQASEEFDATTLDQSDTTKTAAPTGYANAAAISANGFYDPDDTTIQAYEALITMPVATNFKVTYTDSTPTSVIYAGSSFGLDKTISPADAVKCAYNITTSGDPS